jgi:hypothetical protein
MVISAGGVPVRVILPVISAALASGVMAIKAPNVKKVKRLVIVWNENFPKSFGKLSLAISSRKYFVKLFTNSRECPNARAGPIRCFATNRAAKVSKKGVRCYGLTMIAVR